MSLRDHLQVIYDQHGRLTPELVVQVARNPDHPLHEQVFDRSPSEAADAYYRDRAQDLIRRVRISYRAANGDPESIRAFQSIRGPDGYGYEPTEKVAADPVLKQIVLRDMEREWKALRLRYSQFEEFAQMIQADLGATA